MNRNCLYHLVITLVLALWGHAYCFESMAQSLSPQPVDTFSGKPRVVVISDIGGDVDDQESFVRLMLYSNDLDIEALIAGTSTWLKTQTHPEIMHTVIDAYGQVRSNLLLHAKGWPTDDYLHSRVFIGQEGYGLASTGRNKTSAGSQAIVDALKRNDSRPLWICIWGGANTLAQALMDLRDSTSREVMRELIGKLRVYSISDQDDAGPWLRREFPDLFYIVLPSPPDSSNYIYATWTGISGDVWDRNCDGADTSLVTNEWLDTNIRSKGPLGKVYPRFMFIMEGDTPSFLGLLNNGLNAFRRPDWGGWGGRYLYLRPYGETHSIWTQGTVFLSDSRDAVSDKDNHVHVSDQATIWRWRDAYQNEFAARMNWSISDFTHANHNPSVVVNGKAGSEPIEIEMNAGQTVTLDAAGTKDPDDQPLTFRWFVYPEAGLNDERAAEVEILQENASTTIVRAKNACKPFGSFAIACRNPGIAHIILAVTDNGSPRLTSYRRIILHVKP